MRSDPSPPQGRGVARKRPGEGSLRQRRQCPPYQRRRKWHLVCVARQWRCAREGGFRDPLEKFKARRVIHVLVICTSVIAASRRGRGLCVLEVGSQATGFEDVQVGAAAAQIAGYGALDLLVGGVR